jgi:ABC-type methionine transport system ATPase subunit
VGLVPTSRTRARPSVRLPARALTDPRPPTTVPAQTEQQVIATLVKLRLERPLTIVLCTHSITAAASTDRVIMLADGVVAETGPFTELVAKRGPFFALTRSHLGDSHGDTKAPVAAGFEETSITIGGLDPTGNLRGRPLNDSPTDTAAHTTIKMG